MSQYLDKDGATRIAENFLSKQAEQDAILRNLQFDLKEAEHALVKTVQGPTPLNIRALSRPLDDYAISGNTVQNDTPTPDSPVDVVGCGVRTGNLIKYSDRTTSVLTVNVSVEKQKVTFSGTASSPGGRLVQISNDIVLEPGTYKFSISGTNSYPSPILQSKSNNNKYYSVGQSVILESNETFFISFVFAANQKYNGTVSTMLNLGSTALPYEPYGYKLPLTVNGTEYPIYLGQVPTTRRIKKLVLTGEEGWGLNTTSGSLPFFYSPLSDIASIGTAVISTHFQSADVGQKTTEIGIGLAGAFQLRVRPDNPTSYTLASWKGWLSTNQPTIWYVLSTPETTILNEPLHKISTYADTLSMAQAGVEISTTKGFNTITTDTTVLPSNIEVKGVINNA